MLDILNNSETIVDYEICNLIVIQYLQSLELAGIVYEIHYIIEKSVCLGNIVIAIAFHLRKVNFAHNFPFLDPVPDVHSRHSLLGSEPSPGR